MNSPSSRWPLAVAALALVASLGWVLAASIDLTGRVSYALDDAYIHMAMAKNFAEHGVWGITRHGFTSSSSSLIWTFSLAVLFKIVGTAEWIPLALNACLSVATLFVAHRLLSRSALSPAPTALILLGVAFLTPLISLSFTGQEHVLQTLITLLFIDRAARELAKKDPATYALGALYLLGPLAVLSRFEGLFYTFIVCCLFLLRRRIKDAFTLGAATLAPLALFGALSVAKGWYPLPNSVLMKGNLTRTLIGVLKGDPTTAAFYQNLVDLMGGAAVKQLITAPHVAGLFVAALLLFALRWRLGRRFWDAGQLTLFLFGATTFFHMELAKVGWFYRYEAYLVALGLVAIGMNLPLVMKGGAKGGDEAPRPSGPGLGVIALGLLLAATLIPAGMRGAESLMKTPTATKNIYDQQYQMARFLKAHYEGQTVTANDIGAINFLADIGCVDLVGLASMEAAMRRRQGRFDAQGMKEMSADAGATIAVVYKPWLEKWGGVPKGWVELGTWTIQNNVVVAFDTITWYALDRRQALPLAKALRAFSPELPDDIIEAGAYLPQPTPPQTP